MFTCLTVQGLKKQQGLLCLRVLAGESKYHSLRCQLCVRHVRGALLAKRPDSSLGEVGNIHTADEVKDQEDEVEDGRDK